MTLTYAIYELVTKYVTDSRQHDGYFANCRKNGKNILRKLRGHINEELQKTSRYSENWVRGL